MKVLEFKDISHENINRWLGLNEVVQFRMKRRSYKRVLRLIAILEGAKERKLIFIKLVYSFYLIFFHDEEFTLATIIFIKGLYVRSESFDVENVYVFISMGEFSV